MKAWGQRSALGFLLRVLGVLGVLRVLGFVAAVGSRPRLTVGSAAVASRRTVFPGRVRRLGCSVRGRRFGRAQRGRGGAAGQGRRIGGWGVALPAVRGRIASFSIASDCMRSVTWLTIGMRPASTRPRRKASSSSGSSMRRAQVKNRPARGTCLAGGSPQVTRSLSRLASASVWPERLLAGSALQFARSAGQPSTPGCADGITRAVVCRRRAAARLW